MPHSGEYAIQTTPGWVTPTLSGTWVAYGAPFTGPGWFKGPDNTVHLRGLVKSGTIGTTLFTLPQEARPSATLIFPVITDTGIGRLDVLSTGEVNAVSGGTGYFSLSGIDFRL